MKSGRDYKCRRYRGCGKRFGSRAERATHEEFEHNSKLPINKRSEREATDAALKNGELYGKPKDKGVKEIKVRVPVGHHEGLRRYSRLTGRTITVLVNEALDAYFHEQQKEREENG